MRALPETVAQNRDVPYAHDGTAPLPPWLRGSVMLLGSFDGMHRGHAALLAAGHDRARRDGVALSILQCDPHPRAYFAGPSRFRVSTGAARDVILADAGIGLIYAPRFDAAFAGTEPEDFVSRNLLEQLGVTGIVVGRDFRFGRGRRGDVAMLARLSSELRFSLAVVEDEVSGGCRISTTAVRKAILAGDLRAATDLLGHGWLTQIQHVAGDRWRFSADQILPPCGHWPVIALDADGRTLASCRLDLRDGGRGILAAPPSTTLLRWLSASPASAFSHPESKAAHV